MEQATVFDRKTVIQLIKDLLSSDGPNKFMCRNAEREDSEHDGFTIHFHSWGWLRPHRKQILLETHALRKITVIEREHAETLFMYAPGTWTEAMFLLRNNHPSYEFIVQDGREDD